MKRKGQKNKKERKSLKFLSGTWCQNNEKTPQIHHEKNTLTRNGALPINSGKYPIKGKENRESSVDGRKRGGLGTNVGEEIRFHGRQEER